MLHGGRREVCFWETDGKRQVGSPRLRWEENNKLYLKRIVLLKAQSQLSGSGEKQMACLTGNVTNK
jgi:hypothetical protein